MSNEHITDERLAFEAWFLEKHGVEARHHPQGGYVLNAANMLWAAWQARAILALRPTAKPAGEPFGWWFTEDPDVFCMPGSGFRRFPDKPQHTIECIALYTIEGQ